MGSFGANVLVILLFCSRTQVDETVQKMIHFIYVHFMRGYLEKDRFVFSLLLALEVRTSRARSTYVQFGHTSRC